MKPVLLDAVPLMAALKHFSDERQWEPWLTPRSLMLALTGEVGELAEIFQWLTDDEAARIAEDPARFEHLKEEVADVLLYLVQLARVTGIDLDQAVQEKIAKNAVKYPPPSQKA